MRVDLTLKGSAAEVGNTVQDVALLPQKSDGGNFDCQATSELARARAPGYPSVSADWLSALGSGFCPECSSGGCSALLAPRLFFPGLHSLEHVCLK